VVVCGNRGFVANSGRNSGVWAYAGCSDDDYFLGTVGGGFALIFEAGQGDAGAIFSMRSFRNS